MDAFFGITLSIIVIYMWRRSKSRKPGSRELTWKTPTERQKQDDAELISVIIPTINNDDIKK